MAKPVKRAVIKFVTHSKKVISIAKEYGWLPGARYTNLRDTKTFDRLGFLDIDWKNYNFQKHLDAARHRVPLFTVARDIESISMLPEVIDQAFELSRFASNVIIVPKCLRLGPIMEDQVPKQFIFGFSVPTRYGGTHISPEHFKREVHLLGGRPERQRKLGQKLKVISLDCNRFTLDAAFGDYFDGSGFRPHRKGGYETCIRDSIKNINGLWVDYRPSDLEVRSL